MTIDEILINLREKFQIVEEINCDYVSPAELIWKVKSAYRDAYAQDQRIIFYYTKGYKNILLDIQTILNVIDISNPFACVLTTDKDVIEKYKKIKNLDLNPINFFIASGDFEIIDNNNIPVTKIDITEILSCSNNISENKQNLLYNSAHFCMAPWVHSNITTEGKVTLCCTNGIEAGDVSLNTLEEIFYNDYVTDVKNRMLNDEHIKGCEICYNEEKIGRSSYRRSFNQKYAQHIDQVDKNEFKLISWDARFNNLCNLSCRSCGPNLSTSWAEPARSIGIKVKNNILRVDGEIIFNQLIKHIDFVEEIYFAGGEPLIMKEHYQLLDMLIKKGRKDVRLVYNTNFTKTTYGSNIDVFDLWSYFDSVAVCASLDAEGKRSEYLRCGTNWNKIVKNRERMKEKCPQVYFWVSATTGMINALHVPDFHRSLVEKGLINEAGDFNIQNIYDPEYMRVDRATPELREKIIKKYNDHIKWLLDKDKSHRATSGYQSVIKYLENLKGFDKKLFWSNIQPLDKYYGINLLDVFPELDILPKP